MNNINIRLIISFAEKCSSESKPESPPGKYWVRTWGGFQWRALSTIWECRQAELLVILVRAASVSPWDQSENKVTRIVAYSFLYVSSFPKTYIRTKWPIAISVISRVQTSLSGSQPAAQLSVGGSRSQSGQTKLQLLSLLLVDWALPLFSTHCFPVWEWRGGSIQGLIWRRRGREKMGKILLGHQECSIKR